MKTIIIIILITVVGVVSATPYDDFISKTATEYGVPVDIAIAIAETESGGYAKAVGNNKNGTQDLGLYQLNTQYIDLFCEQFWDIDKPFNPFNPYHSTYIGVQYLRWLYDMFGNWEKAIKAYNVGYTRVDHVIGDIYLVKVVRKLTRLQL
jgi:soluble lytic murein transglycosylase-like protein